jgi:hypothetical protein
MEPLQSLARKLLVGDVVIDDEKARHSNLLKLLFSIL